MNIKEKFKNASKIINKKQNELLNNINYVCSNILEVNLTMPKIPRDLLYPGIFGPLDYEEKIIKKFNLYQYKTPPRGNIYSNIIVSGIIPGTKENYKCESTFLFGTTSTRVVLASLLLLKQFPYFTNIYKDSKLFSKNNFSEINLKEINLFIKEAEFINNFHHKKTSIIFLGKSYTEYYYIADILPKNKFDIYIIKHPSYYLRKNNPIGFFNELYAAFLKINEQKEVLNYEKNCSN